MKAEIRIILLIGAIFIGTISIIGFILIFRMITKELFIIRIMIVL